MAASTIEAREQRVLAYGEPALAALLQVFGMLHRVMEQAIPVLLAVDRGQALPFCSCCLGA